MKRSQISNLRPEFTVFVLGPDMPLVQHLVGKVQEAGFEVQVFDRTDALLVRAREYPPHIVLSLLTESTQESFVESLRTLSSEIKVILFSDKESRTPVEGLFKAGAYDFIDRIDERMGEVVPRLDLAIERMVVEFQLEQTRELVAQKESEVSLFQKANLGLDGELDFSDQVKSFVSGLEGIKDDEELTRYLTERVCELFDRHPTLYLKFVPAFSTLVIGPTLHVHTENQKTVGLRIEGSREEIEQRLSTPHQIPGLPRLLEQVFGIDTFTATPVRDAEGVAGLMIVAVEGASYTQAQVFDIYLRLYRESHRVFSLMRKLHEVAEKDEVTGFYLKNFLREKIDDEVSRSRRTNLPVSLVAACIDGFKSFVEKRGAAFSEQIVRTVAQAIQKTSRRSDILVYLGAGEFVFVLPHTAGPGAAVKAEKLRRVIEKITIPDALSQAPVHVTMSFGVSDFPSITTDSESLLQAADEALFHVIGSTHNKVCLAEAEVAEPISENGILSGPFMLDDDELPLKGWS